MWTRVPGVKEKLALGDTGDPQNTRTTQKAIHRLRGIPEVPAVNGASGTRHLLLVTRYPPLATIRHVGGNFNGVRNRSGNKPEAVHGALRLAG